MIGAFGRTVALAGLCLAACSPVQQSVTLPTRTIQIDDALPAMRSFVAQPIPIRTRPNREIGKDFMDLTFRMESGRPIVLFTRFDDPITVRVEGHAPPSLIPDLRALLRRLRQEAGINIVMTTAPTASVTIQAVPRTTMNSIVPRAACFVVPRVSSWQEFSRARNSPALDWTTLRSRDRAAVFVPSDVAPQEIRDCLHEELAQAIGPLNDLYRLPDSVFNDDNIHAVLTSFDMLILRAYYDPALRNGMTRGEVAQRLTPILDRLNPGGVSRTARPQNDTTHSWITNMETALTAGSSGPRRRRAALNAINVAGAQNWSGPRAAFAHFAYARLNVGYDNGKALTSFQRALQIYLSSPETRLHAAHVAVHLASYAMSSGDAQAVLDLVNPAIPTAQSHENAALLATLMMMKAEALDMQGNVTQARAVRMDSLGWARYGFGSDANVRARMREIANLNPR